MKNKKWHWISPIMETLAVATSLREFLKGKGIRDKIDKYI